MLGNSENSYGLVAKVLHWLVAVVVFGLFALGIWMVELSYYDAWYKQAPFYHKSVGVVLALVVILRLIWRLCNRNPNAVTTHTRLEKIAARMAHRLMYILMLAIFFSGYLISTADNRAIEVFGWFEIPSLGALIEHQEDVAGLFHQWFAYALIALVVVHAAAAVKHQVIDKDNTLKRML